MKKLLKKIALSAWTAVLTLFVVLAVRVDDPQFVESVRLRYFDTLIATKTPTENNVYTVNIDEAALEKYGQYPFKRDVYADLIAELYNRGAGLVVFNVLMPEVDRLGGDNALLSVMEQAPVILPNVPSNTTKNQPKNPGAAIIGSEFEDTILQYPGIIANIPELEQAAAGVGATHTLPEIDGGIVAFH